MSVKKKKKKVKLTESGSSGASSRSDDGGASVSAKNSKQSGGSATAGDRETEPRDKSHQGSRMDKDESRPKKAKEEKESLADSVKGGVIFLKEVVKEAKKITWPPRRQVIQETWSVLVLVTFITVLVLAYDYALANWVFGPLEHFSKMNAPVEQPFSSQPITPSPVDGDRSGLPTLPFSSSPNAPPPITPVPIQLPPSQPVPPAGTTTPAGTQPGTVPGGQPISSPTQPAGTGSPTSTPAQNPATPKP